jgi:hypothetical protein
LVRPVNEITADICSLARSAVVGVWHRGHHGG